MEAQICRQAAVDTGPSGLCGMTSTSCASANAQIFLLVVMPPTAQTSGRTYWQAWRAISTSNSRRSMARSPAACLQICASIPNLGIQELPGFCLNGAEDKMVKEPLRFENGCMLIPEAPGIGIELADDAEELYPANERGSNAARRAFDGAVKDW